MKKKKEKKNRLNENKNKIQKINSEWMATEKWAEGEMDWVCSEAETVDNFPQDLKWRDNKFWIHISISNYTRQYQYDGMWIKHNWTTLTANWNSFYEFVHNFGILSLRCVKLCDADGMDCAFGNYVFIDNRELMMKMSTIFTTSISIFVVSRHFRLWISAYVQRCHGDVMRYTV